MPSTKYETLLAMTDKVRTRLAELGDPQAEQIRLTQGGYGYYLAVYPDGPTRGYSTSRFSDTQHKPSEMWEMLHGMLRVLEGVPS